MSTFTLTRTVLYYNMDHFYCHILLKCVSFELIYLTPTRTSASRVMYVVYTICLVSHNYIFHMV